MCAPYFTNLHFFRVLCHVILPNQCLFPMKSKRSGEFEPEFMHFITKTSPCPYALHLLTSFKPLHGAFEPRLWTQPPQKKTHTSVKSPNNSPTSSEFGPDALGRCDPAHCNLYDTPFPLRRRPTRRCASDPRLQKKKQRNETWGAR